MHTKQENDAKKAYSNRSFDGDKRTTAQARAYQDWQNVQRRAIDEQYRYNEMKAVLDSDMQYADIGSLRRAMRSDIESLAYKKSHYAVRDYKQYARWKNIIGDNNLPKNLAEFQELKYYNPDRLEKIKTNVKNENIKQDIKENYPLTIQKDKQNKHIEGHKNYIKAKSKIFISTNECQEIIDKYSCKGIFVLDNNGNWTNKERVSTDKIIGSCLDNGEEISTKSAMIHYSKNGTHIVPRKET